VAAKATESKRAKRPYYGTGKASPARSFIERGGPLMTYAEAADYLAVTPRMLERLLRAKTLPKVPIRGVRRIHIDDLNAYIEGQRAAESWAVATAKAERGR
jgi:excisionase family DNA binding protein